MDQKQKQNILNNILKGVETAGWSKELDEGFLSIIKLWDDVTKAYEQTDLDEEFQTSLLIDFYLSDESLVKEIKELILEFLKREIFKSIEINCKQEKEKIM